MSRARRLQPCCCALLAAAALAGGCSKPHPLVGRWRYDPRQLGADPHQELSDHFLKNCSPQAKALIRRQRSFTADLEFKSDGTVTKTVKLLGAGAATTTRGRWSQKQKRGGMYALEVKWDGADKAQLLEFSLGYLKAPDDHIRLWEGGVMGFKNINFLRVEE